MFSSLHFNSFATNIIVVGNFRVNLLAISSNRKERVVFRVCTNGERALICIAKILRNVLQFRWFVGTIGRYWSHRLHYNINRDLWALFSGWLYIVLRYQSKIYTPLLYWLHIVSWHHSGSCKQYIFILIIRVHSRHNGNRTAPNSIFAFIAKPYWRTVSPRSTVII